MDAADDVRLRQQQQVVVAFDIDRMVGEGLARALVIAEQFRATIVRLGQLVALDHGAHRTVQNQNALLQEVFNWVWFMTHGLRLNK